MDNNTASSGRRTNKRNAANGNNSASGPRKRGHSSLAPSAQMHAMEASGSGDAGRMAAIAAAAGFAAGDIDPMEAMQLQQAGMLMPGQFWHGVAGMEGASEEVGAPALACTVWLRLCRAWQLTAGCIIVRRV
jgi:hypothetical protein